MNKKISAPVFVFPNIDRVDTSLKDLLSRFDSYGSAYSELIGNPDQKLNIVCGTSNKSNFDHLDYKFLELHVKEINKFRLFGFLICISSLIRKREVNPRILIAGDPFRGLFVCRLLRLLRITSSRIQVSLHGEINSNGFGVSIKAKLGNLLFKILVRGIDSIRLVLQDQVKNTQNVFGIPSEKIVIAPVPISLDFIDLKVKKPNRTLGFVGRLHNERGVDLWIETIKNLKTKIDDFDLRIIGDGPLRKYFEEELEKIGVPYKFTGRLTQSELKNEWENISVLLSTAPAESYGMAMREAVMQGCAVVSYTNSGSKDVAKQYPDSVNLFTDVSGGSSLIIDAMNNQINTNKVERYRSEFMQLQKDNIDKLVKSWA
ncbi:MAG: glycosyltransferase family 4 protein [Chitinophagia bacterium]